MLSKVKMKMLGYRNATGSLVSVMIERLNKAIANGGTSNW